MSKSKLWRMQNCALDHFVGLFPHCSCLTLLQEMERIFTYSNSFSFSLRGHRLLMLFTAAQHFPIQLTSPSTIYHSYRDNTNPLSVFLNRALAYCHWKSAATRALHPQIHEQSALSLTLKCIPLGFGALGRHSLPYNFLILYWPTFFLNPQSIYNKQEKKNVCFLNHNFSSKCIGSLKIRGM